MKTSEPQHRESYESSLARHGQSDLTYVDTAYKPSTWQDVAPRQVHTHYANPIIYTSVKPLSAITAMYLLSAHKVLVSNLVKSAGWEQAWRHVWQQACWHGYDSFRFFVQCFWQFAMEGDFKAHHHRLLHDNAVNDRELYLQSYRVGKKHRVEFIPKDESLGGLVQDLKSIQTSVVEHLVFLDLTGVQLDEQLCLQIMSLRHLTALDVSGTEALPDRILSLWKLALNEQWGGLRMLCLGKRVTKDSKVFPGFFECKNLKYIEGPLVRDLDAWKHGGEVSGISSRFTSKYTLAQKYSFMRKFYEKRAEKRVMLDFTVSERHLMWKNTSGGNSRHCYFRVKAQDRKRSSGAQHLSSAKPKARKRGVMMDKNGNLL